MLRCDVESSFLPGFSDPDKYRWDSQLFMCGVGYWSVGCKTWFQMQLKAIRNGTTHLRTAAEWRDSLKLWRATRPFIANQNQAAAAFLCGWWHHPLDRCALTFPALLYPDPLCIDCIWASKSNRYSLLYLSFVAAIQICFIQDPFKPYIVYPI